MDTARVRLGQLLVDAGILTPSQLDAVLEKQRTDGRRLGALLVESGLVTETQVTQILSQQLSVPWVSLYHIEFTRQLLNLVPRAIAERYEVVPIYVRHVRAQGDTLYVAMEDPTNEEALAAVAAAASLPVRPMIAPPSDVRSAIRVYYGAARSPAATLDAEEPPRTPAASAPEGPPAAAAVVDAPPAAPAEAPGAPERPRVMESGEFAIDGSAAPSPAPPRAPAGPAIARADADRDIEVVESPAPPPAAAPPVRGRMVTLTLLDGTTITLPAPRRRARGVQRISAIPVPPPEPDAPPSSERGGNQLTARDLVAALRAVSHGADAAEILGDAGWEKMFAALLSVLLRKQLVADWEFIEELDKI